jgi:hypothetical protein
MTAAIFTRGKPWRKRERPDPDFPEMDMSMCDGWVCPVDVIIDGALPERFVIDVQVNCVECSPNDAAAITRVIGKADAVAHALNLAQQADPSFLSLLIEGKE